MNNNSTQNNKRLSVQVTLTGLSFLVTPINSNERLFFTKKNFSSPRTPEELLSEIQEIISETAILQTQFEDVKVIYSNNVYSVVPAALFEESKSSEYLKFNSKILANDFIAHDEIEQYEIVVVYVPYVNITNYFFEKYGDFQYYHGITVFLKKILDTEKYGIVPKMFLHIQKANFDCLVVKDGKLQLCNTYHYKTPEDFIYYTLFCIEQLKLNPEKIQLILCGEIEIGDSNYEMLYKYIRNISLINDTTTEATISSSENPVDYLLSNTL